MTVRAYEISIPGTGPAPKFRPPTKDIVGGWRRQTPPIVESLTETYEHIISKQGRDPNVAS
jgi:hypothetical protein